jgi:hypothetical protein
MEIIFITIFTMEFIINLLNEGRGYFCKASNLFELFLVVIGWLGILLSENAGIGGLDVSMFRITRLTRMFRVLRFLRILRLYEVIKKAQTFLNSAHSREVKDHMQKINILFGYVRAHVSAMEILVKYTCKAGAVESVEICRLVVSSQTHIMQAIVQASGFESKLDSELAAEVAIVRECVDMTQKMVKGVLFGHHAGIISGKEAQAILNPLRDHISNFHQCISEISDGNVVGGQSTLAAFTSASTTRDSQGPDGGELNSQRSGASDAQPASSAWGTSASLFGGPAKDRPLIGKGSHREQQFQSSTFGSVPETDTSLEKYEEGIPVLRLPPPGGYAFDEASDLSPRAAPLAARQESTTSAITPFNEATCGDFSPDASSKPVDNWLEAENTGAASSLCEGRLRCESYERFDEDSPGMAFEAAGSSSAAVAGGNNCFSCDEHLE